MPIWTYVANRDATGPSASVFQAPAPCGPSEAGNELVEAANCWWLTMRLCTWAGVAVAVEQGFKRATALKVLFTEAGSEGAKGRVEGGESALRG